jgi:hypothetical protein
MGQAEREWERKERKKERKRERKSMWQVEADLQTVTKMLTLFFLKTQKEKLITLKFIEECTQGV